MTMITVSDCEYSLSRDQTITNLCGKSADLTMAQLSENSLRVLESRYLQRDKSGNIIEKPDELFLRVASAVARAE